MFTTGGLVAGAIAAFLVGISKTGLPGSSLVSIPLIALVVEGRLIPGATLPILLVADLFAVAWYRHHTRWDVARPLVPWLGVGFVGGIGFFVVLGSASDDLERSIGVIVLAVVLLQLWRIIRETTTPSGELAIAGFGSAGGFTTFVANAAGPLVNTYLASLRLPKEEFIGTSAWLYFAINLSKIPFYIALGLWTSGGSFFTLDSLTWDLAMIPAVIVGVYTGRVLNQRLPHRVFLVAVLILSAAGAMVLIV